MSIETNNEELLLKTLSSSEAEMRIEAVRGLGKLEKSNPNIVLALERVVANDPDQTVQEIALEALDSPPNKRLRRLRKPVDSGERRIVLQEIESWKEEELIQPHLAQLLVGRYSLEHARQAVTKHRSPPPERRSLGEILLSEASIKVALFLGAFFVLSASFILAALVEVARLPILSITTIVFFIGAGIFYRRLRLSSFIMFTVGTLLIAIDGGILLEQLGIERQDALISWTVITAVIAFVFAVGVVLYDSRLFSLLSYGSIVAAVILIAFWFEADLYVVYFLMTLLAAVGVLAAQQLNRSMGHAFFWPLFVVAQLLLASGLAASVFTLLYQAIDQSLPTGSMWLTIGGLWLVGSLIYIASEKLMAQLKPGSYQADRWLFSILAVGSLVPVPLLLAGIFNPTDRQLMLLAWIWGLVLAMSAEAINEYFKDLFGNYTPLLLLASGSLFLLAIAQQWIQENAMTVILLSATAIVYLSLTIRKLRWPLWSGSLVAAYLAYFAVFSLTQLASLDIFPGYLQILPITFLVGLTLVLQRRFQGNKDWWMPPLVLACLVGTITFLFSLENGEPTEIVFILLAYAANFAVYGWLTNFSWAIFGTTSSLAIALHFSLYEFDLELTAWPYVVLGWLYYLAGFVLTKGNRNHNIDLGNVLCWSGLVLVFCASILAPFEGEISSAIAVAIAALLFTLEAFNQRNVWFGYPAALLYFLAYVTVLIELDVKEPQFYSVIAALLGLIMHYLMLRGRHQQPALITGLVSQLVLLGTTYVQMLSTERLVFFFLLFFQGLILLAYGIVIRSRSFVVGPVCFAVVAVISVTFSVLSGLPVAAMIGCTGMLLLILGTAGLWLRQRLATTAGSLGQQLGNWNW